MKEYGHIHRFIANRLVKLGWCLLATTVFTFTSSAEEKIYAKDYSHKYSYNSSIQNSNFLILDPRYEFEIEDQTKDRRSQLFWKLRFDMQSLETEDNNQSQIAGATFQTKFRYKLLKNVRFKAKANLSLESGRSQDIFGDQEPGSGVYPREFLVEWKVWKKYFALQAGLLQQKLTYLEPLFISNLAFPGVLEKFRIGSDTTFAAVYLQQAIPSSYTRSTRVSERENVPYFYTESLYGQLGLGKRGFLFGNVTHYRYENLPAIVAYDSFIFGNTVEAPNQNNARFVYEFDGFFTYLGGEAKLSNSLSFQGWWNTIRNTEAPVEAGEAQSYNALIANDFGRWNVSLNYKNFFIESDAVPGAYNSHIHGHTNRIGQTYGFGIESKDWGVIFRGSYTEADLLNQSRVRFDGVQQDDQKTIYFSVGTMYDFI